MAKRISAFTSLCMFIIACMLAVGVALVVRAVAEVRPREIRAQPPRGPRSLS